MARTASSSRCWGSTLRRESSAGAQVRRRCSWASVSWLPQLELQLGSHFTPQRRCGQGCLTTCCPNTAEGAVELVQLCLVGVQHLGSWLGFEPHLTFSCPNLNKRKLEEKRVRLTTFTLSNSNPHNPKIYFSDSGMTQILCQRFWTHFHTKGNGEIKMKSQKRAKGAQRRLITLLK